MCWILCRRLCPLIIVALKGLKEAWRIPDDVISTDHDRRRRNRHSAQRGTRRLPPTRRQMRGRSRRTWRVSLIQLDQMLDVEEAEKGVLDGLAKPEWSRVATTSRASATRRATWRRSAALIDASVADRPTCSSRSRRRPSGGAAARQAHAHGVQLRRRSDCPGAGTSDTDTCPNVTGVYFIAAYVRCSPLIQVPANGGVLGTVYVPAEVNMVSQLAIMNAKSARPGWS